MIERVDEMTSEPIVGQEYLVPTVYGEWETFYKDWPVLGTKHEDWDHLGFGIAHYHFDWRFIPQGPECPARHQVIINIKPHSNKLSKLICVRRMLPHELYNAPDSMRSEFAGRQCQRDKNGGWICPHRGMRLGSAPVVDGLITCPLHGLVIDAASGICRHSTCTNSVSFARGNGAL